MPEHESGQSSSEQVEPLQPGLQRHGPLSSPEHLGWWVRVRVVGEGEGVKVRVRVEGEGGRWRVEGEGGG